MTDIPIVTLTVDHMKHSIKVALSEYEATLSREIQEAVDAACEPAAIRQMLADQVRHTLNEEIRKQIASATLQAFWSEDVRHNLRAAIARVIPGTLAEHGEQEH